MKKLGLVLILAAFCLAPIAAEAQAVYYYGPQPIMLLAPPEAMPRPSIMIQVAPEPAPTVTVVQPPPPAQIPAPIPAPAPYANVTVSGGISNICVTCSNVTQKIVVNPSTKMESKMKSMTPAVKPKPTAKNGNGNGTKAAIKPWWEDPWLWLIAALIAILMLFVLLVCRSLWGGGPRSGPSGPIASPAPVVPASPAPVPPAPAAPVAPATPAAPASAAGGTVPTVVSDTATIPVTVPVTLTLDPINIRLRATVSRTP